MCLAVPMKVLSVKGNTAVAEFGGLKRDVNIELVPGVKKGDYLIIHAGCAIEKLDREYAEETLSLLGGLKK
jgi:hydrogenase expression/formation protein HypC